MTGVVVDNDNVWSPLVISGAHWLILGDLPSLQVLTGSLLRVCSLLPSHGRSHCDSLSHPPAGEAGTMQAADDVRTVAHQTPDEPRQRVLDHQYDRTLIDSVIALGDPGILALAVDGRVQAAEESVTAPHPRILGYEIPHRRQHDLRREGERG